MSDNQAAQIAQAITILHNQCGMEVIKVYAPDGEDGEVKAIFLAQSVEMLEKAAETIVFPLGLVKH